MTQFLSIDVALVVEIINEEQKIHPPLEDIELLPPEPSGSPNPDAQRQIENYVQQSLSQGYNFMNNFYGIHEMGNPHILQQVNLLDICCHFFSHHFCRLLNLLILMTFPPIFLYRSMIHTLCQKIIRTKNWQND